MLPGPGVVLLISGKTVDLGRERAGASGGTKPHIDLIEQAVIGLRGERADQALRQPRKILRAVEPPRADRFRTVGIEVVDDDEIEIRTRRYLAPAKLPERQDRGLLPCDAAVQLREMLLDRAVEAANERIRQPGESLARLLR